MAEEVKENTHFYAINQLMLKKAEWQLVEEKWEMEINKNGPDELSDFFKRQANNNIMELNFSINFLQNAK